MKKLLNVPKFNTVDEEMDFWTEIDLADYYQPSDGQQVSFPNLKPSSRPISLRLPEYLLDAIKERANELDVPYQSLMKQFLADKLRELRATHR
jgi:predicted DNA binding CopG/RHH family protein